MKIGDILNLSGFELQNFCIQNVTDLETLANLGIGRKGFFTGNDDVKSGREVIYTPSGWRASAYMDDIDKINDKLDLIFGEEIDTDTIIDSWKEVQDFLAGIEDTENLMTMLDGKLDKTGGTISTDEATNTPLVIKSQYDGIGWVGIAYENKVGRLGGLGFKSDGTPLFVASNKVDTYPLIHSGNVGEYAPLINSNIFKDDNVANVLGYSYGDSNGLNVAGPTMAFGKENYRAYLFGRDNILRFRTMEGGTLGDWKTLAFTDSTVEAAKKLETPVSLWDNEFDGTQSLDGSITLNENAKINLGGKGIIQHVGVNNSLYIGYETSDDWNTFIWGKNVSLTNSKGVSLVSIKEDNRVILGYGSAMTITEEGNVLVNHYDLEGVKFAVKGRVHIGDISSNTMALGQAPEYGLTLGIANLGMAQWVSTNGAGNIQSMAFNGTATAYALNLNPLGGAVNVASADALTNVLGQLNVGSSTAGRINMVGSSVNYLWADNVMHIGLSTVGGQSGDNATLTIRNDGIHSGFRNNAVSLGTSSYRWSDVYSVNGNFSNAVTVGSTILGIKPADGTYVRWKIVNSNGGLYVQSGTYDGTSPNGVINLTGINNEVLANLNVRATISNFSDRVLIGGAVDDGETALQVNGAIALNSNNYIRLLPSSSSFEILGHNNELNFDSGTSGILHINYRKSSRGTAPKTWRWQAGSSTEYADFILGRATFNGGALIPTGQKMTFGENGPTMEYDAENDAIKVTGNLYTTGTLSSGGKAEEGEGGTGGGSGTIREFTIDPPTDNISSFKLEHSFNTEKVIVQIFELNGNSGKYEMILTDVEITDANNVTVTFGRKPTEYHKVYVMA